MEPCMLGISKETGKNYINLSTNKSIRYYCSDKEIEMVLGRAYCQKKRWKMDKINFYLVSERSEIS
jgi:hypothetical protein